MLQKITISLITFALLLGAVFAVASYLGSGADKPSEYASSDVLYQSTGGQPSEHGSANDSVPLIDTDASDEAPVNNGASSSEAKKGTGKRISFLACPDNIIHPSVYYDAIKRAAEAAGTTPDYTSLQNASYDFAPIYENIKSMIAKADIAYINVETLIGGNDSPISGYPQFNSPEAAGQTLVDLGFDVFNLAHNHMLDSGNDKYLKNCNRFFRERGGLTLGFYADKADTENIPVIEKEGVKIAFLAYTYSTNGIPLPVNGTYIPLINNDLMTKQMKAAKAVSDLVFVSMHWGDEDVFSANSSQRSTAQTLVDLGADVIIGMHPHVIQESKWVTRNDGSRCLVTYSLGNLVSGMYGGKNALGSLLSFDIVASDPPYIDNVKIIPTVCHYTRGNGERYKQDTGFRDFKIYLLEHYTQELAATHGCHGNKDKISSFDSELDGNFSRENLIAKARKIIPAEFLPEFYKLNNW